eukprot:scaffold9441_cov101-Cylindrotheca_fusiformis.AAC.1
MFRLLLVIVAHLLPCGAQQQQQQQQQQGREYFLFSSEEIYNQAQAWSTKYPDYIHVTTSQAEYDLPPAGSSSDDCPFDESTTIGCSTLIITIQDYVRHPEGSKSSALLPEVFWSGALHGNERVGPTAVMEAARLLLEAATCEAADHDPDDRLPMTDDDGTTATIGRQAGDHADGTCQTTMAESGIDKRQQRWLARLVSTRRIVIVPTANALGYYWNLRNEGTVDPNRDFPYDGLDPTLCMQSIAARTINEVFRDHLFQSALTFHAGLDGIGYEWGAPTWDGYTSPDDVAQNRIAEAYSIYGRRGPSNNLNYYPYGPMNSLMYPVRGGMEDWAYAGSWDDWQMITCDPQTYNGYPIPKTEYNNSTLRAFNMLIETGSSKEPTSNLGSSQNVLDPRAQSAEGTNGHIPRNMRLSLLSADLVEPYVSILQVNGVTLQDVVPLSSSSQKEDDFSSCRFQEIALDEEEGDGTDLVEVEVAWTVGGALSIDDVQLWFVGREDLENHINEEEDCLLQPTSTVESSLTEGFMKGPSTGNGQFSSAGSDPTGSDLSDGPVFRGTIHVPADMTEFVIYASARVDGDWIDLPSPSSNDVVIGPPNVVLPQSHMANARNDPNWSHESAGKKIQGRLNWFSQPLSIVLENVPTETPLSSPPSSGGTNAASANNLFWSLWVVLALSSGSLLRLL